MTPQSPSRRPFRWRPDQQWEGYLFILPSFAGFLVFIVLAVVMSLGISFSEWGLTGFKNFAGLLNYRQLLRDPVFWQTFWNTAFYIVTIVPLQLALGLAIAVAADPFGRLTGLTPAQGYVIGAAFVLYGLVVYSLAAMSGIRRVGIALVVANAVGTVGFVGIAAAGVPAHTSGGVAVALACGAYTAIFAVLQYLGVRRLA